MAGCGGNPTLDVVNKFIAAEDLMFSTGDGSGLMAVEDANIVIHMMNWPDTVGNAAHVAAVQGIVAGAAGPITHVWSEITAIGDIGSVRWVETGTVGGKSLSYQGAYFLKVKDGKIIEAWLISDMLTYFLAAGIVQYAPPPSP
jgi:ketosteroid isomerase-like protein